MIGWLFLFSSPNSIEEVLAAVHKTKYLTIDYFGLLHDTLNTKNRGFIGESSKVFYVLMVNSLGVDEVETVIEQTHLSKSFVVKLNELDDDEIEDTEEKGLIVKKIEYLDELEFYDKVGLYRFS